MGYAGRIENQFGCECGFIEYEHKLRIRGLQIESKTQGYSYECPKCKKEMKLIK